MFDIVVKHIYLSRAAVYRYGWRYFCCSGVHGGSFKCLAAGDMSNVRCVIVRYVYCSAACVCYPYPSSSCWIQCLLDIIPRSARKGFMKLSLFFLSITSLIIRVIKLVCFKIDPISCCCCSFFSPLTYKR